jgi:presequence protease
VGKFFSTSLPRRKELSQDIPTHESFVIVQKEYVKEYDCTAVLYEHRKTKGRLLSILTKEDEKVFGITFKTPVSNNSGVAHILEHSVLCGSQKYPIKEPFTQLMKSSLQTYLNAMTYNDRTVYPVASPNLKDFYHLVGVYLDAVFQPKLEEWVLQQEGWHYEFVKDGEEDGAKEKLSISGVVYNEMKGVYANSDAIHGYAAEEALFPDVNYKFSSGGDPIDIPCLSYKDFRAFHTKFYHPSNAYAYFYGDDDPHLRLVILDEYFSMFEGRKGNSSVDSSVGIQSAFKAPVRVSKPYPVAPEEFPADLEGMEEGGDEAVAVVDAPNTNAHDSAESLHEVSVQWVLHDANADTKTRFGLSILSQALLRTQTSPLYRALLESGLGNAVLGDGYDDGLQQAVFSIGLKGVKCKSDAELESKVSAVESTILSTLEKLSKDGFSKEHIESTVNSLEFNLREFSSGNTTGNPKGLSLYLSILPGWLYGRSPVQELQYEKALIELKREILSPSSNFLVDLINTYFLQNNHRVTLHMYPEPEFAQIRQKKEDERLDSLEKSFSQSDIEEIKATTEKLLEIQSTPDSEEDIATIPTLKVNDLPLLGKRITGSSVHEVKTSNSTMLLNEQSTSGILYSSMFLDFSTLPMTYIPLIPLYTFILSTCGTSKTDEVTMSQKLGRHTGGISFSASIDSVPLEYTLPTSVSSLRHEDVVKPFFLVSGKALAENIPYLLEYMQEMITSPNFLVKDRILQQLKQVVTHQEQALVSSGHRYATSLLMSSYSKSSYVNIVMNGFLSLYSNRALLQMLSKDGNEGFEKLLQDLQVMHRIILDRENKSLVFSLTGDEKTLQGAEKLFTSSMSSIFPSNQYSSGKEKSLIGAVYGNKWSKENFYEKKSLSSECMSSTLPDLVSMEEDLANIPEHPITLGISVPTQVNYNVKLGKVFDFYDQTKQDGLRSGSCDVILNDLQSGYLWDAVRVKGGAYGAYGAVNKHTGVLSYTSYRDPNVKNTFKAFDGVSSALSSRLSAQQHQPLNSRDQDLEKAILSTIGSIDAPTSPSERGSIATSRFLFQVKQEQIDKKRREVLDANLKDLKAFQEGAEKLKEIGSRIVVGSEESLASSGLKFSKIIRPLAKKN